MTDDLKQEASEARINESQSSPAFSNIILDKVDLQSDYHLQNRHSRHRCSYRLHSGLHMFHFAAGLAANRVFLLYCTMSLCSNRSWIFVEGNPFCFIPEK